MPTRHSRSLAVITLLVSLQSHAGSVPVVPDASVFTPVQPAFDIPFQFPDTTAGSVASVPCLPLCATAGSSDLACTVTILNTPSPPFHARNLRVAPFENCGGTPASSNTVVVSGDSWAVVDLEFAPQGAGSFSSTFTWGISVEGSEPFPFSFLLSGNGLAAAPSIAVSSTPAGMIQPAGSSGARDQFSLTNNGTAPTTITLTRNGDFFTQEPSSFTLAAGATQTVTVTALAQPQGEFSGASIPAGAGVPAGLSIPIRLLSSAPPTGPVIARPATLRPEVSGPPNQSIGSSVGFTNDGTSALDGIVVSDSAWLIPQPGRVAIAPGGNAEVAFTVDPTKRPDASNPLGSVSGTLTLSYLTGSASKIDAAATPTSTSTSVVVVAVAVPTVTPVPIPELGEGQSDAFVPGVSNRSGQISDVFVSNVGGTRTGAPVSMFYSAASSSSATASGTTINSLNANSAVAFANVVKTVFAVGPAQSGTVQVRTSSQFDRVAVGSVSLNLSDPRGSFGTALPVFRPTDGVDAGEKAWLPGLVKDTSARSDLYVQETAGGAASVVVRFLSAQGNEVGSSVPRSIPAFGVVELLDAVPQNAVSAVVENNGASSGNIVASAIVLNGQSGDSAALAAVSSGDAQVVPLAVTESGSSGSTRTEVAVMNTSDVPITGSLEFIGSGSSGARKRAVRRGGSSSKISPSANPAPLSLAPRETRIISDVSGLTGATGRGFLRFTPSGGSAAMTARLVTTANGRPGSWGSTVPTLPAPEAIGLGEGRTVLGIGDSRASTVSAARPGTWRTHFGFAEVGHAGCTVRVTAHFAYAAGAVEARGKVSRDFEVPADGFLLRENLMNAIIGSSRETALGDLRDIQVDFQVVNGAGAVIPFTWSIDNGSGDMIVR